MSPHKHLQGLKILDFSAVYTGSICARFLSDCGADVIKVETPEEGDITRGPKGISRVFAHFNAGKRSIALDLKKTSGQAIAHAASGFDVAHTLSGKSQSRQGAPLRSAPGLGASIGT